MKNEKKSIKRISLLVVSMLLLVVSAFAIMTSASESIEVVGEMVDIEAKFSAYRVQDTVRTSDEYVGDYQYTIYYDTSKGEVVTNYLGTPVVIYTVNHPAIERIGTDSNETIIGSMLDRGYVVVVLDYLNNYDAKGIALEYSAQQFRLDLVYGYGKVFTNTDVFSKGNYRENFLVPSGYNLLVNQVFWEIDKHSANGTFDKIVENWNSDFRATKGDNLVLWMHTDGTRKAVQNDFDGNAPVWYDENGKADENGTYTYVKYTKAEVITDCIDPDGSFLDMNLYLHLVYPTSPENEVPVMALSNSSGYPTSAVTQETNLRPQSAHFLYDGYAYAVFDHCWEPMARNSSWGYYDGAEGVSKDHMNYSLMMYNDKLVNTAAMRFIRYTSLAGGDTFNFDIDKIGAYGNSKGGWFNFLGEAAVQSGLVDATKYESTEELEHAITLALESFTSERMYNGHHGETRYSAGKGSVSGDGITLSAGLKQPWLTYDGKEIISGAQITIPENGGSEEDVTEGHMPIYVTSNLTDYLSAHYGVTLKIYNVCRELDLPLLHLELPVGHMLPIGQDLNHNVDSYDIFARFANYYLKNDAVSVAYVAPMNNAGGVNVTDKITVAFVGQAELSEVQKITVSSAAGVVSGTWESSFGGVVWTFTPDALTGGTEYTVTVPAGFSGTNGTATENAYTTTFITEFDVDTKPTTVAENTYTFTAPKFTTGNSFVFRFNVKNDAANVAEVYANGTELLGSVNLRGAGSYEIDITDYVAANSGKEINLVLKEKNTVGNTVVKNDTLSGEMNSDVTVNKTNVTFVYGAEIDGSVALEAKLNKPYNYTYSKYFNNVTKVLEYGNVIGSDPITKSDVGRLYTFSIDVYDTTERAFQVRLKTMTDSSTHETIDYDAVIRTYTTVANEWTTYTFTYRVYEPDYGLVAQGVNQFFQIFASPDGDLASPLYIKNLTVTEVVTGIEASNVVIAEKITDGGAYAPAVSSHPFAIYNGTTLVGEYDSWSEVLGAYTSGYSIKLQCDYTFTDADVSDKLGSFTTVNLDLGAYTVTCDNTKNSLLWVKATNKNALTVNVTGGAILVADTPIVSYESSTSNGSGKTVNVNLDGVAIGLADLSATTSIISASELPTGVVLDSNISLNNCAVNLPDAKRALDAAVVFAAPTSAGLDLGYTLKGGSIALTSRRWISVIETTNSAQFVANENGEYTKLLLPESDTYEVVGSYFSDKGYVIFEKSGETDNIVTYSLAISENSTVYGVIPEEYTNGSKYPFLLFKDGSFVSAHTSLSSVATAAKNALGTSALETDRVEILLRADHTATNSGAISYGTTVGTILFDLGGYTLTRGGNAIAAPELNESTPISQKSALIFKNGRVETKSGVMFVTHFLFSTNGVKTYDVLFDNVTIGYAEGATSLSNALWNTWLNSHKASVVVTNITFRNCTFDLKTNAPASVSKAINLMSLGSYEAEYNVVIEGGTILGDGTNIKFASKDASDTLTLKANENGEYIKLVDGDVAPDLSNFVFEDGKYRSFSKNSDGVYVMTEGGVDTPYGTIPSDYASAESYPFAIFSGGEFKAAYATWKSAVGAISTYAGAKNSKATILLRRNYTVSTDPGNGNFATVQGELTVDLGGFEMIRKSTIFSWATLSNDHSTKVGTIIIKNGKLLTTKAAIFANMTNATNKNEKVWNITVENVTLGFAEGASAGSNMFWVAYTNTTKATYGANTNVTFNNCTFDLETNKPSGSCTLLKFKDDNSKTILDVNMVINGGKIISNDLASLTLYSLDADDSIKFGEYNGETTKLITTTTAKDASHYNKALPMANGDGYFVEIADDGINSVYELRSLVTPYGTAPTTAKYLSAVDYPFYVFMNGSFVSAATKWSSVVSAAMDLVGESAGSDSVVQIVLRRDYDVYKSVEGSVNFNKAYGTIIVDLGGYTVTTVDGYFVDISISNSSATYLGYESRLVVRNGAIFNKRSTLPSIGIGHSGTSANGAKKTLSFTFENVTFKTINYAVIRDFGHSAKTGMNLNFVFDDCTFDFGVTAKDTTMFHLKSSQTNVVTNVKFVGGEIKTDVVANYTLINYGTDDKVVFAKDSGGNYTVMTVPTKNAAPTLTFKSDKGTPLSFVAGSTSGNYTIYVLEEFSYAPKASLTLDSNLMMNVYVPVENTLKFTFDGKVYENLSELEGNIVVLDDGKSYYHMTVALPAAEAARDIVLSVSVSFVDTTISGSFTMNVPKYAAKLIANGTEVEKTLARDVLVYVKAAYEYFRDFNTDVEIARVSALVNSIIGDYTSAPVTTGTVNTVAPVTAVTLNLSSEPSIRFYVTNTNVEFFLGERKLNTVKGKDANGSYVELNVYAFALCETITYTGGGSYHISDFLKGAAGKDYEAVVNAFVKYTESAKAYREEWLAKNPEA